jgi:broad specificity phosphatase PhoE
MIRRILYLSHPEVKIDPQVPVPEWEISDMGRSRVLAAVAKGWPGRGWLIVASPEVKAVQTAELLANAFALPLHIHPEMGEVDRASTGYVPHARHEALADALFANLGTGPEGWESAQAASTRIVKCFEEVMAEVYANILFVGHGAVGTFLWCALTQTPISRQQDQKGSGSYWAGDHGPDGFAPLHPWRTLEDTA